MDQITHKLDEPEMPPDWLAAPSPELAVARRAHLSRVGGFHGKAKDYDNVVRAWGKDANAIYATASNKINLAEGPSNTATLCMDLVSARKVLKEKGGRTYDANLQVQLCVRDVKNAALGCRSKFKVV